MAGRQTARDRVIHNVHLGLGGFTDVATLGIKIENGQAVRAAKELDTGLKTLSKTADSTLAPFDKMTRKIDESRIKFEAWQRQLAQDRALAAHVTQINAMRQSHEHGIEGVGRLKEGFASLATQLVGVNPIVGHLATVLGSFAVGTTLTIGILAGVAAIAAAYDNFTESTRKAKEETERFLKALRDQARAAKDATVSGSEQRAEQARQLEANARAAARRFDETGGGPSWQAKLVAGRVTTATEDRILAEANAAKVLAAANKDIRDAERAGAQAMFEFEKSAAEGLKRIDAERAAAVKKADEAQLLRFKQFADIVKNSPLFTTNLGAGVSFAIDTRMAADAAAKAARAAGSQVADTTVNGMPAGLTHQQQEQWTQLAYVLSGKMVPAAQVFVEHTSKMSDTMKFAAQAIGNAAVQLVTGKFGGGTIGGAVGGGIGQAAAGQLGGFGGTAFGQAIFAPIFAGFGAAIGKGIDSIFDFSGSIAAARKAMEDLRVSIQRTVDVERAKIGGGNVALVQAQADVKAFYAKLLADTDAANKVRGLTADPQGLGQAAWNKARDEEIAARKKALDEVLAFERDALAKTIKYVTETQKVQREDLEVRALRAQGHTREADALALQLRQRQELLDAEKAGMDAAYLARLREVQAIEKTATALNDLNTSVRNAPSTFKIGSYVNQFAPPRQGFYPGGGILPTPYTPQGGPTRPSATVVNVSLAGAHFDIGDSKTPRESAKAFVNELRRIASETVGPNAPLADALDYA